MVGRDRAATDNGQASRRQNLHEILLELIFVPSQVHEFFLEIFRTLIYVQVMDNKASCP